MRGKNERRFISQVQNRVSGEETGEEELRETTNKLRDEPDYQLNEAGGPLGEEFKK